MRKILNVLSLMAMIAYFIIINSNYVKKLVVEKFDNQGVLFIIYMSLISLAALTSLSSLIFFFNKNKLISLFLFLVSIGMFIYWIL